MSFNMRGERHNFLRDQLVSLRLEKKEASLIWEVLLLIFCLSCLKTCKVKRSRTPRISLWNNQTRFFCLLSFGFLQIKWKLAESLTLFLLYFSFIFTKMTLINDTDLNQNKKKSLLCLDSVRHTSHRFPIKLKRNKLAGISQMSALNNKQ